MQRSAKPADLKASPFIPFRYQQSLIKTLVEKINQASPNESSHRACPDSIGEPASSEETKEHASSCHLEPDSPEDTKEHTSERSPERKHENEQSPSPDRKHDSQPFIIQKSSSIGATSAVLLVYLWYFLFRADSNFLIMTPNIFDLYMPKLSNYAKIPVFNFLMFVIKQLPEGLRQEETKKHASSCHLEPVSSKNSKEHASERSPERKCENEHSPSPDRKHENPQSPSGKRKTSSCFFIPGTRIKFVINRKKHFYCYLENTTNGNRIVGLSAGTKRDIAEILNSIPTTPSNSQPPSFTSILLDDHAFHTHADHHYLQLSRLTSSIISVSGPNGQSNLFYELADTAKKEDLFILHWIHNPLYDRAWYDTLIQTASARFVEQFINQQFAYRYRNKHKHTTPPLNSQLPIAEQYVTVSLSTFFPKESGKETSTKPANNKTPQKKTTTKPANSQTPNKKASTKSANTQTPAEKAAFNHDTPTSATPKPKRPPIISALTGFVRKHVKTMTAITYNTYYDVRNHISKSHKANLSQPFVPYEDYNEKTIVQSWNRLNRLIANKINMQLISGEKAVRLVNKYSSVPVSQSLIVTSEADRKLRYEFRVLFFNDGFVKNYYRKLLENRRRIEAAEKKRIEDERLEKEVEEYNRQFREKYDKLSRQKSIIPTEPDEGYEEQATLYRLQNPDMMESELINDFAGLPSDFTTDQLVSIRLLLRDYSILKAEKRNRMAREDRERYPAIYEAMQKPRPKRDKYYPSSINWDVIFPDGYRSDRYPDIDYTPQPEVFKPSKENEEEQMHIRILHASWERLFKREDGRYYPRTIDWDVTFTNLSKEGHLKPANQTESSHLEPVNQTGAKKYTSERSPERKRENPKFPSPERKQEKELPPAQNRRGKNSPPPLPADLSAPANCPPEITYCPLGSDYHIPCYPECPHGMIHNYNRYMREEEAKSIQEKEKSKKKGNKSKSKNKKDPKAKNKGRPPPA